MMSGLLELRDGRPGDTQPAFHAPKGDAMM